MSAVQVLAYTVVRVVTMNLGGVVSAVLYVRLYRHAKANQVEVINDVGIAGAPESKSGVPPLLSPFPTGLSYILLAAIVPTGSQLSPPSFPT